MLEVTDASEDHRHVMLVRRIDDLLIFHGTARLDHRTDRPATSGIEPMQPWMGNRAFEMPICAESTRLICPAPMPTV